MTSIIAKTSFTFHGRRVERAFDPVVARALFKMSAFVQRRMKSSIKQRRNPTPAPAGSPPISHTTRKPNLRTIAFAVDVREQSAVIGPIEFRGRHTDKPAPQTLEFGGVVSQQTAGGKRRRARIRAHPFARPALVEEIGKFPELLKG